MSRPDLFCLNSTDPLDEILIKKDIIGNNHDKIKMITKREKIISNNLFESLFKLSFKGSLRKLKTGTLSKKLIFNLLKGKPLKSGTTLNRIKFKSEKSTSDLILFV